MLVCSITGVLVNVGCACWAACTDMRRSNLYPASRARRTPSSRQHAARTAAEAQPARTTALEACRRGDRPAAGVPMRRAAQTSMRPVGRSRWWGGAAAQ